MLWRPDNHLPMKKLLLSALLLLTGSLFANERIARLRCEEMTDPIGIDVLQPRLSWELESDRRGVLQTAYRILVATDKTLLDRDQGDMWDSGEIESDATSGIKYAGKPLQRNSYYYWKVKANTNKGETAWSEPALWQVGLLQFQDWVGQWIGFDRRFPWDGDPQGSRLSARYFRKEFDCDKEIRSATAYIIGLGFYELRINGRKIGDRVLAPVQTEFTKNVKYNAFDVTDALKRGRNAIGIVLGNGMYFTMQQFQQAFKIKNFGYPKVLFNLAITYADGSSRVIFTNDSWKGTADGPIRANNLYDGEEYDATREFPGWDAPGFDDGGWLQAEFVQEPGGTYEAQTTDPMKVVKELAPVSVTEKTDGRFIVDFGQNLTGWMRFSVRGARGQTVRLRYAESLDENGELFTANLRSAKAEGLYTLRGGERETYEPAFTYYGFRFVEVSGYPGQCDPSDFTACMVSDDMRTVGSFKTSDELLNSIYRNAWWGIAGNYKGMPVDCPQRNEKQPWLGDRGVAALGENFVFDNAKLYRKLLDDLKRAQKADGSLPDLAPDFWRYFSDNMTWPGVMLIIADMLYTQTGDLSAVSDHYDAMKKWLAYMKGRYMTAEYIVSRDVYGDWCAPPSTAEAGKGLSGNVKKPNPLLSTAYYYHFTGLMQKFAELTGRPQDKAYYAELGENIKNGFNRRFYRSEDGYYDNGELTSNLLPVAFGMVPAEELPRVTAYVGNLVEVKNRGHLSTGVIGTQWLMKTLSGIGRPDLALGIALKKTYPSWGYMITHGATTIWELWNFDTAAPDMNSQNHVMMLGDLLVWFYENLAGIRTDPAKPAFRRIVMNPDFPEGLDFVEASHHSVSGKIESRWRRTKRKKTEWNIRITANCSAEVHFPAAAREKITESGHTVAADDENIRYRGTVNGKQVFEVLSGEYSFVF